MVIEVPSNQLVEFVKTPVALQIPLAPPRYESIPRPQAAWAEPSGQDAGRGEAAVSESGGLKVATFYSSLRTSHGG